MMRHLRQLAAQVAGFRSSSRRQWAAARMAWLCFQVFAEDSSSASRMPRYRPKVARRASEVPDSGVAKDEVDSTMFAALRPQVCIPGLRGHADPWISTGWCSVKRQIRQRSTAYVVGQFRCCAEPCAER